MADTAVLDKPAAARRALAPAGLQHEVEQFLYHEAALVDEGRFREWLEVLADDITYVMKTNTLAQTRDRRNRFGRNQIAAVLQQGSEVLIAKPVPHSASALGESAAAVVQLVQIRARVRPAPACAAARPCRRASR